MFKILGLMGRRKSLKKLGKVIHKSHNRFILVSIESDKVPAIGAPVIDGKNRKIGRIYDVIGPVSSPYALVKPIRKDENVSGYVYVRW